MSDKNVPRPVIMGIVTPDQENPVKTAGSPHPEARTSQAKIVANALWTVSRAKRLYTKETDNDWKFTGQD